jgi:hypothetical protein
VKRSNPRRNVPHEDKLPEETVGEGRHRSPHEFKAHRKGRKRPVEDGNVARMDRRASHRVDGADGSWPDRASSERRDPKPPAILVMYPDIAGELGPAPEPVYGQYPRGFIAKMLPWLDCDRREILHLCSGCLPKGEGIRVDIRLAARPDIIADVTNLPIASDSIAAVMADPPYSPDYARRLYGVKYPRPSHVLAEAARVVRPGGMICFVHYITPAPPAGTVFVRAWALSTGFDMPVRAVTLYRKNERGLL